MRLITIAATMSLLSFGCGTTGTSVPSPEPINAADLEAEDAQNRAAAEKQTRAYVSAKIAHDWGTMWDLAATVHRDIVISVGKAPAEADDQTARAQGFESAAAVKAMSDRDWFIARRQTLAKQDMNVYKKGATPAQFEVRRAIMVPFPGKRIRVHPVHVTLSDGTVDKLAATREGGRWRMLEK